MTDRSSLSSFRTAIYKAPAPASKLRLTAILLSLTLGGCSLGMKVLPADYDPRTIPRCETDAIYPLGDAVVAVLAAGTSVAIAVAGHDADDGSSNGSA